MTVPLRVIFAGTPAFGLPALEALAQSGHEIISVYTQPDRPAGRGRHLQASPVKQWALDHNIPVYQPLNFKSEATRSELSAQKADVMVVAAYGLILPGTVLAIPALGCVNVHASLLPRWRGASPIQHAILHGDTETGVTIMQMDSGMDTGAMLTKVSCAIEATDTAASLHDKLAALAPAPLLACLEALAKGQAQAEKQDAAKASYAPRITKAQALIDWATDARAVDRQVRAYYPWPVAYTLYGDEQTLRIIAGTPLPEMAAGAAPGTVLSMEAAGVVVACKQGSYRITQLQFSGRKAMPVRDWLNGSRLELAAGDCFKGAVNA